ncbi:beta-glucosidase [Caldimonas brevitalea]|uniref:Beta-glucosidase n=2 Tax=Caldimonas brevitalea TaxID=413882 RepID=A0A0G3BNS0_9BURK|nr:beta-glucosidase [Caldimonas brevitalea]
MLRDLTLPSSLAPPEDSSMWRPDFLFGAATAAYQIEGAAAEDGRLASIWDIFSRTPGKVLNGDTGDHACDHYRRWAEDLELVAGLGLGGYRLSIAWPRVMDEAGRPNTKGLDFYKRLLDRLQQQGLQAFVTLYHWDLPQHLQDRGGWLNRDTVQRFADYADVVSRELAGRVNAWTTLNEPWCSAFLGYGNGHHAPGLKSVRYAVDAMHHLLLAHGEAVRVLRGNDRAPVGIVSNVNAVKPDSERPEDLHAARLAEACANHWVLDPLLLGHYPEALRELWPGIEPAVRPGDLALISTPLDYLGINYYFRANVGSDGAHGYVERSQPNVERTQMGWEVYPEGLRDLLVGFKRRYPGLPPIYITENGMASDDRVVDGRVDDPQRIDYLRRHFAAVDEAMRQGVEVKGYFVWSLLDNFEWAYGYERRFGIVHVDYRTQQRTLKDSALALREFLAQRRSRA